MLGRPTDYSDELAEQAMKYIEGGYDDEGHAIPSVVGLASVLNRAKSTLYRWAQKEGHPFCDILELCMEKQEQVLFSKGLTNDFNASIVKLALGKHGYHDKQDQTLTGPNGGPLEVDTQITVELVESK